MVFHFVFDVTLSGLLDPPARGTDGGPGDEGRTERMTAKNKRAAKPSFYREQLTAALKVHPDIIRALLEEGRLYTVSEAEEAINRYMTRKV